jgi:hypothetical protein
MPADERKIGDEYKLLHGERKTAYGLFAAARNETVVFYGDFAEIQIEFA